MGEGGKKSENFVGIINGCPGGSPLKKRPVKRPVKQPVKWPVKQPVGKSDTFGVTGHFPNDQSLFLGVL